MRESIAILYQDQQVIVVLKPPGWLTVPGRGNKESVPVLSHLLGELLRQNENLDHDSASKRRKEDKPDLYVIHRLDEGTSGVVIFAKTAVAHRALSMAFEGHEVEKEYWCLVRGHPEPQTIEAPLFRIPSKKNKSVVSFEKGKTSVTKVKERAFAGSFGLVEAIPLTGRSHQIRVHMAHIGFPILGDKLYGGETNILGMELSYPLLHARRLSFVNPSTEVRMEFVAPLVSSFLKVAQGLGFAPGSSN